MDNVKSPIFVCVFDNPASGAREAWQNGKLIAHITMDQMYQKDFNGNKYIFFGLNVGRDFVDGKIYGNPKALLNRSEDDE